MGNIRIERVPIEAFELGKYRADHLMLVYQHDTLDYGYYQDRWWVMEGTRDGGPGGLTIGVDGAEGTKTLSEANGNKSAQALLDAIHYPWWRGSKIIASEDSFNDWMTMAAVARNIDDAGLPYVVYSFPFDPLPTANSSSVIATLLYYIGVDITQNMPSTFFTYTTGTRTLLGTTEDDELLLEWSFNTILGGGGNDQIAGTNSAFAIEKFYGGRDNDTFQWSKGFNIIHGGEPNLDYSQDGVDLIDYSGAGVVTIETSVGAVPHLVPNYIAHLSGATDYLFSIERVRWADFSDEVVLGPGVAIIEDRPLFDLEGEDPESRGDSLDVGPQSNGIMVAPSDQPDVVLVGTRNGTSGQFEEGAGVWVRSLEWLTGTAKNDVIHAGATMRGIDGGQGDDILSGRKATSFAGLSPQDYDIELNGGEGNDILVSGAGRSIATGGAGDDIFVLSTMTFDSDTVEFVIADASTSDRLYVPYNFLSPDGGEFAGSELFPILGGMSPLDGASDFADLPQHIGSAPGGVTNQQGFFYLIWQTQMDAIQIPDASDGMTDIAGQVFFDRDGDDLLIHVFSGEAWEDTLYNAEGEPYSFTSVGFYQESETVIRVKNFSEGMLGIQFFHLSGEGTTYDYVNYQGPGSTQLYPEWDDAVTYITDSGSLAAPLDPEPETPIFDFPDEGETDERPRLDGGDDDDVIVVSLSSPATVGGGYSSGSDLYGYGGNDTLTGASRADHLDGGQGADAMSGGSGNDTYVVDNAGDTVAEVAGGGFDTVRSSIDFALGQNVEHLTLTGSAVAGTGNDLANRLLGNSGDNILIGGAGADTLHGAGGHDVLDGGTGGDAYVYRPGDGVVRIVDLGDSADTDTLRVTAYEPGDATLHLSADGSGVVVRFADGGRVLLDGFVGGHSADRIAFDDGTVWDRAAILAQATLAGMLLNDAPVATADDGYVTHLNEVVIAAAELLGNDTDFDQDPLSLIAAATETAGAIVSLTETGDVRIAVAPGQDVLVAFTYTVADGRGGTATGHGTLQFLANAAPILTAGGVADVAIAAGSEWTLTLPLTLFSDPDGHSLVYSAALTTGAPLPAWLSYDADTRTFAGTPPADFSGTVHVRVTASDGVLSSSTDFAVSVDGGGGSVLTGTEGDDVLTGTAGNDVFDALGGQDRQEGGLGDDTFLARGEAGFDLYLGGEGFDRIVGSAGNDIIGLQAAPVLIDGIEAIDGGDGFDVIRLSEGSDVLDLSGVAVTGIERIHARSGHDTVIGSSGDDIIRGGAGNDDLSGGAGNDRFTFAGRSGADTYNGGAGVDRISGSAGDDILFLQGGSADLVSIERIALGGGFDILQLGGGHDTLDLSGVLVSGLERIEGGAGNDRILGSARSEAIAGGGGRDVFVFRAGGGQDRIVDYELGGPDRRRIDVIDVSEAGFADFQDVMAHATQSGADTVITMDGSSATLRLEGILRWSLRADDFVL